MLYSFTCLAGDWTQWWHDTPGRNEISNQNFNDLNRNIFHCKIIENRPIHFIEKWYFLNNHIVGTFESNLSNKTFIIDENTCKIDTFINFTEFESTLKQRNLKPVIWTRWHNDNWGFFFIGKGYGGFWDFYFIRGTWFLFTFLIGIIILLRNRLSNKNLLWYFEISIFLLAAVRVLLDFYPQSI